jgi:hypothetical protein
MWPYVVEIRVLSISNYVYCEIDYKLFCDFQALSPKIMNMSYGILRRTVL